MSTRRQQTDNSSLFDLLETTIGILLHDIPACCTRYSGYGGSGEVSATGACKVVDIVEARGLVVLCSIIESCCLLTQYRSSSMTRECRNTGVSLSSRTVCLPAKPADGPPAIVVRIYKGMTRSYSSSVTTHALRRYDLPRPSVDVGRPRPSFALCCHDGLREHATKSACTYGLRKTVDSDGHHKTP